MTDADARTLTCRELVELVTDYLDGALPSDERARFEAHLGECDPCVEYVAQLRRTIALVGRLDPESIDPQARDHLLTQFRSWRGSQIDGADPAPGRDRR